MTIPATHDEVLIVAAGLKSKLQSPRPPAVLDVRWKLGDPDGRRHYAERHIPTAVYVDLDGRLAAPPFPSGGRHPLPSVHDLERAAREWGICARQSVVVYDDNGGMSAARAWWLLRWAGISDVRILDGALSAWIAAGFEVESGTSTPVPGDVALAGGHLPVLTADEAGDLARTGVLLDARAAERYRGEVEPVDPRAGHIPRAISFPTADNLGPDGRFLDPSALRARCVELGVDGNSPVGVYCGSGVTAAHLVAALQIAGIEASMFPGSWSAWSSDPQRPVAVGAQPG
jgi:thiosulfate/3-mercaptopyruvate sulfurtransferase